MLFEPSKKVTLPLYSLLAVSYVLLSRGWLPCSLLLAVCFLWGRSVRFIVASRPVGRPTRFYCRPAPFRSQYSVKAPSSSSLCPSGKCPLDTRLVPLPCKPSQPQFALRFAQAPHRVHVHFGCPVKAPSSSALCPSGKCPLDTRLLPLPCKPSQLQLAHSCAVASTGCTLVSPVRFIVASLPVGRPTRFYCRPAPFWSPRQVYCRLTPFRSSHSLLLSSYSLPVAVLCKSSQLQFALPSGKCPLDTRFLPLPCKPSQLQFTLRFAQAPHRVHVHFPRQVYCRLTPCRSSHSLLLSSCSLLVAVLCKSSQLQFALPFGQVSTGHTLTSAAL